LAICDCLLNAFMGTQAGTHLM